ncbi:dnaJ domain-containing protein [Artemisia annua]|uniref:DnaJ domain-containing protein n=1 Tax=Artemisia annua TaxID=35608 RepID=A0A2U1PTM1_ARTAN|nr:dnaJ domain-containing protein [Artemisia annua]
MGSNKEEALRAKEQAEKLFAVRDFAGAKRSAIMAQVFFPQLEGIAHMVATYEIYAASEMKINGEIDLYSVLGLDPSAKKSVLRKQYKRLAVLLHPDKNKTIGADEAFKLVSEAWTLLSDNAKRTAYDLRRNKYLAAMFDQSNTSSAVTTNTFWTVCTSCRVQYEYLRKYVNKRLSCKNCRGVFVAVETGSAPVAYCPWSYTTNNGPTTNHSYNNEPFQWNTSAISDPNGFSYNSVNHNHTANGNVKGVKVNGIRQGSETQVVKMGRPRKRKLEVGDASPSTNGETSSIKVPDVSVSNVLNGFNSIIPTFDARKLLIDKARSVIRVKLEEMKSNSKAEKNGTTTKKILTVPDPDFHDFDSDRSEEVFQTKQIWAIYDEEDGMPRLYCLIRQVTSVKPFRVHISYLNSKTDTEFGNVKWIESGFTKSCGSFRVFHSDVVDQVNIFSHLLGREKAGRGGCVRIYPKSGDIWAVYRNWSENWNRKTPKEVVHQYEMVEIVGDYSEERGVRVANLVKVKGYTTVYQRDPDEHAVRWFPRREMLRFSHQVPSCLLKGEGLNLPDGCWDLDPAATPEELLQG